MNTGAFGIIGIGVFILVCGYASDSKGLMGVAAFILLIGFGLLTAKNKSIDKETGKPFYKCPNCGRYAGKEVAKEKMENGKTYKCMLCNYKW